MKKIILVFLLGVTTIVVCAQTKPRSLKEEQDILSVRRVKADDYASKQFKVRGYIFILQFNKKDYTGSRSSLLGRCGKSPITQSEDTLNMRLVAYPYSQRNVRRAAKCKFYQKQLVGTFQKAISGQYLGKWVQVDLKKEKIPIENQAVVAK